MNTYRRAGFKWSINEILSLQREFELLGWDINKIAEKHNRSPEAIMYKLDQEGFADYNVLYSNYNDLNAPIPVSRKPTTALNLLSEYDDSDNDDETICDEDDEEYFDNEEDEDNDEEDNDEEDEVANLSERVNGLEYSISEIKDMIKSMISSFSSQKQSSSIGSCP